MKNKTNKSIRVIVPVLYLLLISCATIVEAAPFAWVTNDVIDTVTMIDTATNSVTATIPVGDVPSGIAVNPSGSRVYVAHWYTQNVLAIDTATNSVVANIFVGGSPNGVAVHPDGSRIYVTNFSGPSVAVIDASSNMIVANILLDIGVQPDYAMTIALNPSGTRAYVTQLFSSTVAVIDTTTNQVLTHINVAPGPTGIAVNPTGTRAYVASQSDFISIIDITTNNVVATIPVLPIGGEKRSLFVAVNPAGTRVYVTNGMASTVSVMDTATNSIIATIPVYGFLRGIAVTPSGTRIYVASADGNVYAIDTGSNRIVATIPAGTGPACIAIGPNPTDTFYAFEYLPLVPRTTWEYLKDGEQTVTREVLNNKVNVSGVETSPVEFIEENVAEYLTSDSNGIFLHRAYQPNIYVSGVGLVDIDVTFIPPIKLADGEAWIGQSFHSEGTARTSVRRRGRTYDFDYTADSTIEAEETVTVPAGTFDAIRYREWITINGQTLSMIRYLAKGIGIVKDVATNPQGETATVELVSYIMGEVNPPTGSIMINGGVEATKSAAVTLTLTASDDTPGKIQMCISNRAICKTWTAFAATKNWMLTRGNGTRTVNVWFKDVWGNVNTSPYSETIILDTLAPTNGTVTATPGDTQVTLDWTGFTDTGSGIGSYKVVYAKGRVPRSCSTGTMIYSGTDPSYIHTGLTNGTMYGYRVCAIDKVGNISKGATARAKPIP